MEIPGSLNVGSLIKKNKQTNKLSCAHNSKKEIIVAEYVLSRVRLFAALWTVTHQAPLSMGFSMQKYWSGLPFPSPGDLPDPGIEPKSPALQADSLSSEPPGKPLNVLSIYYVLEPC